MFNLLTALHMVSHVINSTEDSVAAVPLTWNSWIVLGLVPRSILLATETAFPRLRTVLVPTEKVLAVPMEVLAQVAGPHKYRFRVATRVGAAPCTLVIVEGSVLVKIRRMGRRGSRCHT